MSVSIRAGRHQQMTSIGAQSVTRRLRVEDDRIYQSLGTWKRSHSSSDVGALFQMNHESMEGFTGNRTVDEVQNEVALAMAKEDDEQLLSLILPSGTVKHADSTTTEDDDDDFLKLSQRQEQLAEERRRQRRKRLREVENPLDDELRMQPYLETIAMSNETKVVKPTETVQPEEPQKELSVDQKLRDKIVDDDEFDMFSSSVSPVQDQPIMHMDQGIHATHANRPVGMKQTKDQQQDWDDAEGYYKTVIGETIDLDVSNSLMTNQDVTASSSNQQLIRFRVAGVMGKGVFSTVLKCAVISNSSSIPLPVTVAMKCIRHNESMAKAALTELQILLKLQGAPGIVPLLLPTSSSSSSPPLEHRGHVVLVFHFMEYNLRDVLLKFGKGVGLSLQAVRSYFGQLLAAVTHLQKHGIIHADLKPDNILVRADFAVVQIADFGSAMDLYAPDAPVAIHQPIPYLVSRFYRAPEIILGLSPLTHAIDLWSVAVTVAELYLGDVLFRGTSNNDMLYVFQQHMGPFSNRVIRQHLVQCQRFPVAQLAPHFQLLPGTGNSYHFTQRTTDTVTGAPILKVLPLVVSETNQGPSKFPLGTPLSSKLLKAKSTKDSRKMVQQFTDLLSKCLALDPTRRIALKEALRHEFFVTTIPGVAATK
jgi:serine/threonine-protein kinase PRP4